MRAPSPAPILCGSSTFSHLRAWDILCCSEDAPQRVDLEDLQEPDSLDMEKSFLCNHGGC